MHRRLLANFAWVIDNYSYDPRKGNKPYLVA